MQKALGILAVLMWIGMVAPARAVVELNPAHPKRYVVVKGDTLWDIAGRFLRHPWQWPEIWHSNPQVHNPDLIYPGDVLVLIEVDGQPRLKRLSGGAGGLRVVKLSPTARSETLEQAVPAVPPRAIFPFLTDPLVIEPGELDHAGYVLAGVDNAVMLGRSSEFYARGVSATGRQVFQLLRPGKPFVDPHSGEMLGVEADYLGDARLLAPGPTARLEVIASRKEISPGDRMLRRSPVLTVPAFQPHAPDTAVSGWVLRAPDGISEIGTYSVVVVSLGARDGIQPGHVLRILQHRGKIKDPVNGQEVELPDSSSGLLMVFRVFDKVSYGLIMQANRAIHIDDRVVTP